MKTKKIGGAKELLEAALTKKQVWPWPQKDDEGYDDKVAALKKLGYREWKNKSTSGKSQRWRVTHEEAMPGKHAHLFKVLRLPFRNNDRSRRRF